jgi:hypothetical protein
MGERSTPVPRELTTKQKLEAAKGILDSIDRSRAKNGDPNIGRKLERWVVNYHICDLDPEDSEPEESQLQFPSRPDTQQESGYTRSEHPGSSGFRSWCGRIWNKFLL